MKQLTTVAALFVFTLGACADESGPGVPSHNKPGAEQAAPEAAPAAPATPEAEAAPAAAAAPKAAIFLLGEDLTGPKIQALGASLAGLDGILAAKPDSAAGTFVVTFTPGQVTPEAIGARLAGASPGAEFMGLTAPTEVPADHDDCGKCPYKDECASAH